MVKPAFLDNLTVNSPSRPLLLKTAFPLILLPLLALHLHHAFTRRADPDEFQTLLNAADFYRGQILYVDYWDNHGPLMTWLAAPLFTLTHALHHQLFYVARASMFLNTLVVLALVWLLTRLAFPALRMAAPLAVLLLAASPTHLHKSIEFRPDNPSTTLFLGGLSLLLSGMNHPKFWRIAAGGFLLALISGFTLKVLIMGGATLVALATIFTIRRQRPLPTHAIPLVAGGIAALMAIISLLYITGSWAGFLPCYLGGNVSRDHDISIQEFLDLFKHAPAWAMMLSVGCLVPLLHKHTRSRFPVAAGIAAAALFLYLQFALLLPTKHLQSLLPAHPLAAVGAGGVLAATLSTLPATPALQRRLLLGSLGILSLIDLFDLRRLHERSPADLSAQLHFANTVSARLEPNHLIFDPSGMVFLQPHVGSFHVLVTFVRDLYEDGKIDLHLPDQLSRAQAVIGDKRTFDLPQQDLELIQRQFRLTHSTPPWELYERTADPAAPPNHSPALLEALSESEAFQIDHKWLEKHGPVSWFDRFMQSHQTRHRSAPSP